MRWPLVLALVALPVALLSCSTTPEPPGREAYLDFCAGCHGRGATGAGAMPELVEAGVADLTGLSAANGGVFPMARVLNVLGKGTDPHDGVLAMPDFGAVLGGRAVTWEGPGGTRLETTDTILMLAEYLQSVQQ